MDLRNQVKQVLRHCGHALVSTIHDRLNGVEAQLNNITVQAAASAESQTALLQSAIYAVEILKRMQVDLHRQYDEQRQQIEHVAQQNISLQKDVKAFRQGQEAIQRQGEDLKQQVEMLLKRIAGSEESQAALMQSLIHIVENLHQTHAEIREQAGRVLKQISGAGETQADLVRLCTARVETVAQTQASIQQQLLQQIGETSEAAALLAQVQSDGMSSAETQKNLLQSGLQIMECLRQEQQILRQQLQQQAQETSQQVLGLQSYTQNVLEQELVRQVCVETSDYGAVNPETGLMEHLYSFLPSRKALDVGAHVGEVSERLLKTGYEVYAFEPYPPSFQKLVRRLGREPKFHPYNFAIGCREGELPLYLANDRSGTNLYDDVSVFNSLIAHSMPDDLPFSKKTIQVPVKNLANLHRTDAVPADIGLVKIDTEGYDLEVIRGMDDFHYPVVLAEFWDRGIPFGKSGLLYTPESLIEEMKTRGYGWNIVIYRIWGRNQRAFYCNHSSSVPESWGNIIFFRGYDLFAQAQAWCSAVLPRTFFKPVQHHSTHK